MVDSLRLYISNYHVNMIKPIIVMIFAYNEISLLVSFIFEYFRKGKRYITVGLVFKYYLISRKIWLHQGYWAALQTYLSGSKRLLDQYNFVKKQAWSAQQKQPPEVFYEENFLEILQNSQENNCAIVSFFNKVADLRLQLYGFPKYSFTSKHWYSN